jgi:asparaginyl-tRNA synthetase
MSDVVRISELPRHVGESVTLRGWLANKRSSGKIKFLIVRDGSDQVQAVVVRANVEERVFEDADRLTQESSIIVRGTVREDKRAPSGVELDVEDLKIVQLTEDYPITKKEHGVDFLLEHRHLWLRSPRQQAILRVRSRLVRAIRDYFDSRDYVLIDSPILTPNAVEGTTTLFPVDYFGDPAFLSQSGQLYLEPAVQALGRVYCFGPAFRAEKSKTRRHLTEFWIVEPEVAYMDFPELLDLTEDFLVEIVARVLERSRRDFEILERDVSKLEAVTKPLPRISYDQAIDLLKQAGHEIQWGADFGAPDETVISEHFDKPVLITHYPAQVKAFYMQPEPGRPEVIRGVDVIAPEGYGEIVGGGERLDDYETLLTRLKQHGLEQAAYQWYLDVRRYGSVPHSGFGMGLERCVAWLCKLQHLREAIPYPRMLYRLYP